MKNQVPSKEVLFWTLPAPDEPTRKVEVAAMRLFAILYQVDTVVLPVIDSVELHHPECCLQFSGEECTCDIAEEANET